MNEAESNEQYGDRTAANLQALQRASKIYPLWVDVLPAAEAVGLEEYTLLHAGPPFKNAREPSDPILSSAILCCLYEGWADSEATAEQMILSGEVSLKPAHDYDVVIPLAAVISPLAQLVEVQDLNTKLRCWSLLSSGSGPQIRFGSRDLAVLGQLKFRDQVLGPKLREYMHLHFVPLLPLAIAGLKNGDDLHYQTTAANQALHHWLDDGAGAEVSSTIESAPLFFLTLWMAACRLIVTAMSKGENVEKSSLVVALAGNGESMGLCTSAAPDQWLTVPGTTPQGPAAVDASIEVAAVIGDSGVIDAAGFGAQLWYGIPEILDVMKPWYQGSVADVKSWMTGRLQSVQNQSIYSGLDIYRITRSNSTPFIAIAMLEKTGQQGIIGKGVAATPKELFIGK